eukprot:5229747-Alexandrium_andersonii.AAC.1
MSASLVGSEMCIRDRTVGRARGAPSVWALCPTQGWCSGLEDSELHASEPVSYTHLTLPTICSV